MCFSHSVRKNRLLVLVFCSLLEKGSVKIFVVLSSCNSVNVRRVDVNCLFSVSFNIASSLSQVADKGVVGCEGEIWMDCISGTAGSMAEVEWAEEVEVPAASFLLQKSDFCVLTVKSCFGCCAKRAETGVRAFSTKSPSGEGFRSHVTASRFCQLRIVVSALGLDSVFALRWFLQSPHHGLFSFFSWKDYTYSKKNYKWRDEHVPNC